MRRVDIPRGLGKCRDACECDDRSDSNALNFYLHSKLIILLIEFFRKRQDFDTRTGFEMFAWLAKMQKNKGHARVGVAELLSLLIAYFIPYRWQCSLWTALRQVPRLD